MTNCESATYLIKVRAATDSGASTATVFHLAVDGVNVTGGMTLPVNPYTWQTVVGSAYITAGAHALQLVIESGDTNAAGFFDYITIYKAPPAISNPPYPITVNNLQTGYNLAIAKANAVRLQQAFNTLPSTGGTVTLVGSGPYYFCQPNPIESFSNTNGRGTINTSAVADVGATGNPRSDVTAWVGFQFTVGNSPLYVTQLGRWVVSRNSQTHGVKLVNADGSDVIEGGTGVSTANKPAGQFVYQALGSGGVTLSAHTTYWIVSSETAGGDQWCDSTPVVANPVITVNGAGFGSNPSYYIYQNGSYSYGPVSFLYSADPAQPVQNYACLLGTNNVTIQGDAGGTTLAAFNRDTTILYLGSWIWGVPLPGGGSMNKAVTNILVRNITFQGTPTVDFTETYTTNGLSDAVQMGVSQPMLGSLVVVGGYYNPGQATTNFSGNISLQNCNFFVPSTMGVSWLFDSNVCVTNCTFTYFTNTPPSTALSLKAWCGMLSQWPLYDLLVVNCGSIHSVIILAA